VEAPYQVDRSRSFGPHLVRSRSSGGGKDPALIGYAFRVGPGFGMAPPCKGYRDYSYRRASIGFSRAAFRAGKKPETMPTSDRITKEIIITLIEACRKIAPS
jgi:hypothetical protein